MLSTIKRCWRLLIILLTPIVLLPLPLLVHSSQARCAYVVLLLTVYWVSEAMPYAVASLLPLVLFPLLSIVPGDVIGHNYFKDITTLFVGSMTLAHAMEYVHLQRRLTLFVLSFAGSSMKWSMAGLMGVTAFLSMWINNSAATSIMMPAAVAIIDEIENHQKKIALSRHRSYEIMPVQAEVASDSKVTADEEIEGKTAPTITHISLPDELTPFNDQAASNAAPKHDYRKLKAGFLIAVAYSTGIGGLMTLVGTNTNIFTKGFVDEMYGSSKQFKFEISFGNFFLYAVPMGLLMLVFCWFWLQILFNRHELFRWKIDKNEKEAEKYLQAVFKQQYQDLNPLAWQEIIVIVLSIVLVILWIIRDFSSERWLFIFHKQYATDGTIALLIGVLPLILPNKNPFQEHWEYEPILPWNHLSKTFPWGVFMLQGAGLAMADGFKACDLSSTLVTFLGFLVDAPRIIVILLVIVLSAFFTEFTSNLACASMLYPILNSIARIAHIHPAHLIMPSCMAVSLSFMLPIATPPNAMILANSHVRIADLIKAGIVLKLFGILVIFLESVIMLTSIFHFDELKFIGNTTQSMNASSN